MDAAHFRGGDVPAPRASRITTAIVLAVTLAAGMMVTTRRAEAAATGSTHAPLRAVQTHPRGDQVDLAEDADDADESGSLPPHLVLRLRVAHSSGDLDLFEDVALEVAYHLVR